MKTTANLLEKYLVENVPSGEKRVSLTNWHLNDNRLIIEWDGYSNGEPFSGEPLEVDLLYWITWVFNEKK